jgi:hypothetical protein
MRLVALSGRSSTQPAATGWYTLGFRPSPMVAARCGLAGYRAGCGRSVRLAFGGVDGCVTVASVPWGSEPRVSVPAQVDSTRVQDGLGRRILAAHLGALLSELAEHSDSTSAVVVVDYEAWRECAIALEWWSLAAAMEREVRRS